MSSNAVSRDGEASDVTGTLERSVFISFIIQRHNLMCEQQAEIMALCDIFGFTKPVAVHASLDLAYELTTMDLQKCTLMYFYVGCLMRVHPYTQDSRHRQPLPKELPDLPLPAALAPGGVDNYKLKRSPDAR
jgi:hypothetical protein